MFLIKRVNRVILLKLSDFAGRLLLFAQRKILMQIDAVIAREKFISVTSRITGVDKTCESKNVMIASAIYETKDDL